MAQILLFLSLLSASCLYQPIPPPDNDPIGAHAVLISDGWAPICSGVAFDSTTALTAAHCVREGLRVDGQLIVSASYPYGASRDVALVGVERPLGAVPVILGLLRAQRLHIAGYGCSHMTRLDIRPLTVLGEDEGSERAIAAGRICPGDSGGGVFDEEGRLVGIGTAYFTDTKVMGAVITWVD